MASITTAEEALKLVADWYKTSVPEIEATITKYGGDVTSVESILGILIDDGTTAYDLIYNADGSARTLVYNNVTDFLNSGASSTLNAMHQLNSNATATAVAEKVKLTAPVQAALSATGAGVTAKIGATAVKTGLTATTVVNPISAGIAAVGAGVALGVGIDAALYKLNPHFWSDLGLTDVPPSELEKIVDPAGLFTGLFKTDVTAGTSQMYLDENALAYMAKFLNDKGVFNTGEQQITYNVTDTTNLLFDRINLPFNGTKINETIITSYNGDAYTFIGENIDYMTICKYNTTSTAMDVVDLYLSSKNPFKLYVYKNGTLLHTYSAEKTSFNGKQFYAILNLEFGMGLILAGGQATVTKGSFTEYKSTSADSSKFIYSMLYAIVYGIISITGGGGVEGITKQDGATTPNISKDDSLDDVLSKLKEQYKKLWDNALTVDTPQPDGTIKRYTYVPVGTPLANGLTDTQPTSEGQAQTDTEVNTKTSPSDLVQTIIDYITSTPTDTDKNNDNTGTGTTPPFVPVKGEASALYSIYNPTLAQINSLGAWLWSSNFIDQLLKLFASPMDAIIGLHKVYATPSTGGTQNIKVGYLDSGVSSKIVNGQYTTIDCGTVNCFEKFGNVLDYSPYTNIRLYLPFIGIIDLANSDVMRSSVNVVYHVDVLSGACLAEVKITRDGGGGTLYQFAGNAATTLPISSGSYMGVVSSVASVATRALAGFASGGALGAVASGATGILGAQGTNVQHSGGFSGNAGAMGCKKPYLIIERPQTETAQNTARFLGYGSNTFAQLKTCKGWTKVKAVHVDAIPGTKEERRLIEEKLTNGVIIN